VSALEIKDCHDVSLDFYKKMVRWLPTDADNLLKGIEREVIPESEPQALREIRVPVERPAHKLTGKPCKAVASHA